ncbi:MAG: tyrosine-type recombinase/integrase, partial [Bacteroidia bacterium]|nr:tyrosine-type recombinase/integrase [Bacteroidia bacterium]
LGENTETVFRHLKSKRAVLGNLKQWAKAASIKKNIHIHVGRHSFATLALSNGVSLYTVSKILGHSSIAQTQIYAEVIDEMKQYAADLMPVL